MIKPVINYFGGKRRIAGEVAQLIRANLSATGTYYEPFVGGGAVWLALEHDKNVIADVVPDLILMYKTIQESPDTVWQILNRFPNTKADYYKIRNFDRNPNFKRTSNEFQSARFIYTCITAFGSTRYNSKGQMNQSYFGHPERKVMAVEEDYLGLVERLKYTEVYEQSFEKTLQYPKQGDFVYLDPPYINAKYDQYWKDKFKLKDMQVLKECCNELDNRGVRFALSHAASEEVNDLFSGYNRSDLSVEMCIKYYEQGGRRKEHEYLITNF